METAASASLSVLIMVIASIVLSISTGWLRLVRLSCRVSDILGLTRLGDYSVLTRSLCADAMVELRAFSTRPSKIDIWGLEGLS